MKKLIILLALLFNLVPYILEKGSLKTGGDMYAQSPGEESVDTYGDFDGDGDDEWYTRNDTDGDGDFDQAVYTETTIEAKYGDGIHFDVHITEFEQDLETESICPIDAGQIPNNVDYVPGIPTYDVPANTIVSDIPASMPNHDNYMSILGIYNSLTGIYNSDGTSSDVGPFSDDVFDESTTWGNGIIAGVGQGISPSPDPRVIIYTGTKYENTITWQGKVTVTIPTTPKVKDCAGVLNGSAYTDYCGRCVEGTTGKQPCVQDCDGVWGGHSITDESGNCVFLCPCCGLAGTCYEYYCNTKHHVIENGECDLVLCQCCLCYHKPTPEACNNACNFDCNGVFGGEAYKDNCNNCVGENTGQQPCSQDCAGVYGGSAYIDKCSRCVGGNTGAGPCCTCCNSYPCVCKSCPVCGKITASSNPACEVCPGHICCCGKVNCPKLGQACFSCICGDKHCTVDNHEQCECCTDPHCTGCCPPCEAAAEAVSASAPSGWPKKRCPVIYRDSCEQKSVDNSQKVTEKFNQPDWEDAVDVLYNDRNSSVEHSISLHSNQCENTYSSDTIVEGDSLRVKIPVRPTFTNLSATPPCASSCTVGAEHTHPSNGYPCLSAQDLKTLAEYNKFTEVYDPSLGGKKPGSGTFTDLYSIGANGEQYDFHVEDPAKLAQIADSIKVADGGFDEESSIGREFSDIERWLNQKQGLTKEQAHAFATAAVMEQFNIGVKLLKEENGTFKELRVTPVKNDNGKIIGYRLSQCK